MNNTDYKNLGFECRETNANYISYFKNGSWDEGNLKKDTCLTISAFSTCLHYGQEAFEGLKAYRRKDGEIQLFRPRENALRLQRSCKRLLMPEVPVEKFIDACEQVVRANKDLVPPYGTGATLYLRPFVIGVGDNLGVRPAKEYIFNVICSPVGSYFKGGLAPNKFMITTNDRAAPNGTGSYKVGGNYAASLWSHHIAKQNGYADCIYLDPLTHTKIDEVGAANFFGITKDNKFITPKSSSILESITRRSLMYLAKEKLGMEVIEGEVFVDKLDMFVEAGACGTAAVISPIGRIDYGDLKYTFYSEEEVGPITRKLYDMLTGIQYGDIEAPDGWIHIIR